LSIIRIPMPRGLRRWSGVITVVVIVIYVLVQAGAEIQFTLGPAK
jgi:hypothetical protein